MIRAIMACDAAGGVAKNGTLPWPKNKLDLKWFQQHTKGNVVIMGSATWNDEFMPAPLPNRINVVASSNVYPDADRCIKGDLVSAIRQVEQDYADVDVWIIGGPNIIEQTLDIIDEFYLSRIPGEYDCDTFLDVKKIESEFSLDTKEQHSNVTFEIRKRKT